MKYCNLHVYQSCTLSCGTKRVQKESAVFSVAAKRLNNRSTTVNTTSVWHSKVSLATKHSSVRRYNYTSRVMAVRATGLANRSQSNSPTATADSSKTHNKLSQQSTSSSAGERVRAREGHAAASARHRHRSPQAMHRQHMHMEEIQKAELQARQEKTVNGEMR